MELGETNTSIFRFSEFQVHWTYLRAILALRASMV